MKEKEYNNKAKDITLGQAINCMKYGIYIAIKDGKDLLVTTNEGEKENVNLQNMQ